jgi:hypothetical protein
LSVARVTRHSFVLVLAVFSFVMSFGVLTSAYSATTNPNAGCDESHHSDTGDGANQDGDYDSTCDGAPSGNGAGEGGADGKSCAGCVGNADDKDPPGQFENGSDANNGYECDGNGGVAKTNPAHTGCKSPAPSPTPTPTPTVTPSITPSPTPPPSGSPTPPPSATPTPPPSGNQTPSPTPTAPPSASPTVTPSVLPSGPPTPTPTVPPTSVPPTSSPTITPSVEPTLLTPSPTVPPNPTGMPSPSFPADVKGVRLPFTGGASGAALTIAGLLMAAGDRKSVV